MHATPIPDYYHPKTVRETVLGGVSKQTLWRLQINEGFPKSRPLTPGKHVFLVDEVNAWVAKRLTGSRDKIAA